MKPRNVFLGGVLLILIIIVAMKLAIPERTPAQRKVPVVPTQIPERTRPTRRTVAAPRNYNVEAPPRRETSETLVSDDVMQAAAVTGYVVDNFRTWTNVPAGYVADNVEFLAGALRLTASAQDGKPRSGVLESPALLLRRPTLGAPAQNANNLPPGTGITLQIALSRNGARWTPWNLIERHTRPDGNLVVPPGQPSLLPGALPPDLPEARRSDSLTSGPFVRYRLTLSATGTESPTIKDVRIWRSVAPVTNR